MQKEKVNALPIEYSVIPYKKDIGGTRCYRYFTIVQSDVADSLKRRDCPVLYRSRDFSKCLTFAKYFFNVADLKNQYELNMGKCWIAVRGIKYHPAKDAWLWWMSQKQEDIKFIFDEPQESFTNLSATVRRQQDAIATLKHEAKIRERRLSELESAVTTLSNRLAEHITSHSECTEEGPTSLYVNLQIAGEPTRNGFVYSPEAVRKAFIDYARKNKKNIYFDENGNVFCRGDLLNENDSNRLV